MLIMDSDFGIYETYKQFLLKDKEQFPLMKNNSIYNL